MISGTIWKYGPNSEFVFCPDLTCDFRLGKPNNSWIQEHGCYIINAEEFSEVKEGDEVLVDCYYPTIPGEVMNNLGLWCNCKIIKLEQ